jgi:hypothetical protein
MEKEINDKMLNDEMIFTESVNLRCKINSSAHTSTCFNTFWLKHMLLTARFGAGQKRERK